MSEPSGVSWVSPGCRSPVAQGPRNMCSVCIAPELIWCAGNLKPTPSLCSGADALRRFLHRSRPANKTVVHGLGCCRSTLASIRKQARERQVLFSAPSMSSSESQVDSRTMPHCRWTNHFFCLKQLLTASHTVRARIHHRKCCTDATADSFRSLQELAESIVFMTTLHV